jgi:hypothetical protein
MGTLHRNTPEGAAPDAALAVEGMRPAFVAAFRWSAGPGSAALAARAWAIWRGQLLGLHGLRAAEESAYQAALTDLNARAWYAVYPWLNDGRLRRAARRASAAATLSAD